MSHNEIKSKSITTQLILIFFLITAQFSPSSRGVLEKRARLGAMREEMLERRPCRREIPSVSASPVEMALVTGGGVVSGRGASGDEGLFS